MHSSFQVEVRRTGRPGKCASDIPKSNEHPTYKDLKKTMRQEQVSARQPTVVTAPAKSKRCPPPITKTLQQGLASGEGIKMLHGIRKGPSGPQ